MSRHAGTLTQAYFDGLYSGETDPWGFATSPYEQAKYAATLASLPRERYRSALEVGCSVGVFTRSLAGRCDALLALDVADAALALARERCRDLAHVRFEQAVAPRDWPNGTFDLVVLSEVIYYLDRRDMAALARRVAASLQPEGDVVLVHWLGQTDYPQTGDEAAEGFMEALAGETTILHGTRTDEYRLDVLRRHGAS